MNRNLILTIFQIFTCCFAIAKNITLIEPDGKISIQETINALHEADTLILKAGVYYESDIIITKQLTILGEKNAVIDGSEKGSIFTIRARQVTISGLEFRNVPVSYINEYSAIKLDGAENCLIQNNTFNNNFFAIYIAKSFNCTIRNNVIKSQFIKESAAGNGIHLWYCKNITVESNSISGHRDGIYFEFVEESLVHNNMSYNNLRYGLHFMFSNKCNYYRNIFKKNGAGVAVMYTKNVEMIDNRFEYNWGSASFGLLLKDITDSKIENNVFLKNSRGLYSESANRVEISGNTFEANGWAVKIMGNCLDNNFRLNNFLANTFDVATNSRQNFNTFHSNYWDKYSGYDLDHDGFGDIPYRPVKLFSYLVEQNEPVLTLTRSFFVDVLNMAESIIPVLTPQTLVDEQPAMRRFQ
jgi:nitrous oxidase accessory protein